MHGDHAPDQYVNDVWNGRRAIQNTRDGTPGTPSQT